MAFLFEDISAEISLTRRFRAELELGQSVIDALDSAVAVLSSSGELVLSNIAYQRMWQTDPDLSFAEYTLKDAMQVWRQKSGPNSVWDRLRRTVIDANDRSKWTDTIQLPSGNLLEVKVKPANRGATFVALRIVRKFDLPTESKLPTPA
ncbi:hypothetical protein [Shimia abyssi]|uniref:hypothetical protein n=1 Tax=Shimia abyssi TaxID=1662395 RepID=UPI0010573369|nr:hypothetical protein [Shimia abyssi]